MADDSEQEDILIPVNDLDINRDEVLGRGGFGEVCRGCLKKTGEAVAIKLLISKGSLPKRNIRDLKKEARRLKQLTDHASILNMYGALMEPNHYGLVLEYMLFGSSANFVKDYTVDLPLLLRIARQVVDGMVYLHSHQPPILHLDMKADNILINYMFDAKICDFGLSEWKTVTCSITGGMGPRRCTISHIAPEVLQDINAPSTMALDIYAFGITLWELITAKPVYNGRPENLIRESVLNKQRPDIHDLPGNTINIQTIMTRCWQHDQMARPSFQVIQRDIEGLSKVYAKYVASAMKSIRRQILEKYAVNDEETIQTEYVDQMEVNVTQDVTSHDLPLPAFHLSPMVTDQPISNQTDSNVLPEALSVQVPAPVDGHKSSDPFVLRLNKDDMNYNEKELKKLTKDPLMLDMRDNADKTMSLFDKSLLQKVDNSKSFQELVNNDTVLRSELMRSNTPFFSALSKQRSKQAEFESKLQQIQYRQEDAQKFYSYTKHQRPEDMNETDKRRYERMMDLRVCSYGRKLENNGMADKVIKALKEPGYLKAALDEKQTKPGEPQRFKVIDPKVKELVQDPMILQIVLSQEPELLDSLMRQHPDLIMKLLAEGKTGYKPPSDRPTYHSRPGRDMEFMYRMMRGPGSYDPSRRMYDSDSDDDDAGFPRRPREPPRRIGMMNMMGGSREQRRQQEMMNEIHMDRQRKLREEKEQRTREKEEQEKQKKEEENRALELQRREADQKDREERQRDMDKRMIELLKQQSIREARQKELERVREIQKKRDEAMDNKAMDRKSMDSKAMDNRAMDNKALDNKAMDNKAMDNRLKEEPVRSVKEDKVQVIQDMLKRPHSELRRDASSPGQSMPSIDQLSMEEERSRNNSPQPSPPKQTKDTPQRPTGFVQAETQRARVEPGTSRVKSPSGVKPEPAEAPSLAEVGGRTPGKQIKEEKMEVDASEYSPGQEPANDDKGKIKGDQMKVAPGAPMTISHVHGSGAVTHISVQGGLENVPNLQIGNKNKMIVFQGGASNKEEEEPRKHKKSGKARKINIENYPEDVLNMEQIDKVAMDIGKDWKKLCRAMELSEAEIEQLEYDYNINGLYEMMYQGIQRWMQKKGRRATLREMVKKLIAIERDDLILDLKK